MTSRITVAVFTAVGLAILWFGSNVLLPQERLPAVHEVIITARQCSFNPSRIEMNVGDIVKITFVAEDSPHSFVIDAYRISKRATPGHSVTFEFLADKAGTFAFYSDLSSDEGCSEMRGELIVR